MVRESISFQRQQRHVEFSVEDILSFDESNNNIDTNIEVSQIQEFIDEPPEGYKIVFIMYAVEGYKHHEIANMLNITEGTSKSQLFKAEKHIQKKIINEVFLLKIKLLRHKQLKRLFFIMP